MANPSFRTPRGYAVERPSYQELSEGVRLEASAVPTEAWSGLPPVRVDEVHHDPIVLDAGTIVGLATGGLAVGKLFPAHGCTGNIHLASTSDDQTNWGITNQGTQSAATLTAGDVLPLGIVYQPIYSFQLQNTFTNYKRNENVGILTNYLIQIPAITAKERSLRDGDMVMVSQIGGEAAAAITVDGETPVNAEYGRVGDLLSSASSLIGRYERYDNTAANLKFVVGRVVKAITFATGSASSKLADDYSNITLTTAGAAEWKDLDKVQTVPGLGLAGSGTSGTPGWLRDARSDVSGNYKLLNILVRL